MPSLHKLRFSTSHLYTTIKDVDQAVHEKKLECENRDDSNQDMAIGNSNITHDRMLKDLTYPESPHNTTGRSLIDDIHHTSSDESQSVVESEADTFIISNLTCRLLPKETFNIDEIAVPCTCLNEQVASNPSSEQTKSVEYLEYYNTDTALSRAREILASAKHLQKMIERGFCNSFCSSYECVDYESWTQPSSDEQMVTTKTESSNIIQKTTSTELMETSVEVST